MSQFCVIEGTKISLKNGVVLPIEKITAGQTLLSFDLQTLQKYDILLKLKTNNFQGIFKEMPVKNIWKNIAEYYYSINDKLKITGDHIVLAKRDKIYYWTKVEDLLIGDYLFTEFNIFEKIETIIIIKEKVKVFNLEVNHIFNYFADSYLIHNGHPCSACAACGGYGTGDFNWADIKGDGNITRYPTTGDTDSLYKTATLSSGGSIQYTAILAEPQLTPTDSATIWIKVTATSSSFYLGLLNDNSAFVSGGDWSGLDGKSVLELHHAAKNDRIAFHSAGYVNHSGHPDSSSGSSVEYGASSGIYVGGGTGASGGEDEQANSETEKDKDLVGLAVNVENGYGNILDETCGSGDGGEDNSSLAYNRQTIGGTWHSKYNSVTGLNDYIGMEIIYYETITDDTCTYNSGESIVILHETNPNAYPNVKDGMRITGDNIPNYTYVDRVYRDYDYGAETVGRVYVTIVKQTGGGSANSGGHHDRDGLSRTENAIKAVVTGTEIGVSVTIYGQRLTFKGKDGIDAPIKTMGPSRGITLPQNWASSNTSVRQSINGWAIILGDTQSTNTNTFQIQIQDSNP